jgi:hypothetical protein
VQLLDPAAPGAAIGLLELPAKFEQQRKRDGCVGRDLEVRLV